MVDVELDDEEDGPDNAVQTHDLRELSRNLVEQAAKESFQQAKSTSDGISSEESDVLEQWNPDQVYQRALTWVGEELQEQLLEGFFQQSANEPDDVDIHQFLEYLRVRGLSPLVDPRLKDFISVVSTKPDRRNSYSNIRQYIPRPEFKSIVLNNPTILSAIKGEFVVEDFPNLVESVDEIFEECRKETGGEVTSYIPSLAQYPPEKWATSICTIDGQIQEYGESEDLVTLQSVTKPLFYGICLDELGEAMIHANVGKEPSGHGFNKITLTKDNKAHNPLINTGAISLASMYKPQQPMASRFQSAMSKYQALVRGSGESLHFNNTVYLSEVDSGHRNYAIGYYLKGKGCLEEKANLKETMELYFQMCSIETSVRNASIIAAALANGGKNVFTGEQVISERSVQNVLSIMFSCGMYDFSGEWAFEVGMPAKSGVSGLLIVVIPDVMGLAFWSPPLDMNGNSVRAVRFAREFVSRYSFGRKQNVLHPFSNRRGPDGESRNINSFHPFPLTASNVLGTRPYCTSTNILRGLVKGIRLIKR